MHYLCVRPEVAGGLGPHTVMDVSVHPPIVSRLNYEFDGWSGDVLLASFPAFIVTEDAKNKLMESGVSGARFVDVEITKSDLFDEMYPDTQLPTFAWLQVCGRAGHDDFGLLGNIRLVVSQRVLDILKGLQLTDALIDPLDKQEE